jgi:hypothetical protein
MSRLPNAILDDEMCISDFIDKHVLFLVIS